MPGRRAFLAALAAVGAGGGPGWAQPAGRARRLCWLSPLATRGERFNVALVEQLRSKGYAEGNNLAIEFRSAEGDTTRLGALAAELAAARCDAFFAPGTTANLDALVRASRDTPIVVVATDYDPVATGHVANLSRPGGRITGVSHLQSELPAKRLQLLKEILPGARRVAVLCDPVSAGQLAVTQEAAPRFDVALVVHQFRQAPYDYERAFAELARARPDALLVLASGLFVAARRSIPALALKHRMPAMFNNALWVESGGLVSYGIDFTVSYRRAADQLALIFGGARPGDIPLEQGTAIELAVNLDTARALGIAIPQAVLARTDRLIG